MAVDFGVITVLRAEVEGDVPVLPLFMLFLPRAQGEELSAGRYVHLVMARLVFLVLSGSSPAVQGFPGKGSSAGSELGLLLASRFFFSFSFSYVLLF